MKLPFNLHIYAISICLIFTGTNSLSIRREKSKSTNKLKQILK